jgi:hypothetical protein
MLMKVFCGYSIGLSFTLALELNSAVAAPDISGT